MTAPAEPPPDDAADDGDEDPTAIAEDGMSPLIANTGVDDGPGDDADASSG